MLQNIKKRTEGFTIIEVLIVLAIAGLIMVIVFFAVPALQRNSRNTRVRDDVGKALSAVSDWTTNNSGKIPTSSAQADITKQANISDGVTIVIASAAAESKSDEIQIITGVACSGSAVITAEDKITKDDMAALVKPASKRSYTAIFTIEAAGGQVTSQCQGS